MPQTVYHGSSIVVDKPEIRPVSRPLDFGAGFYTTTIQKRAEEWAQKKALKENGSPVISVYSLDMSCLHKQLAVKRFEGTSNSWLSFVLRHRKASAYIVQTALVDGSPKRRLVARPGTHHDYALVMGEVANDDVFDAIEFFESGVIRIEELRRRLKTKKVNDQLCFCAQGALEFLKFIDAYS